MQSTENKTALQDLTATPMELANILIQNPSFQIEAGQKLILRGIDTNDFVSAISAVDQQRRLKVFVQIMNRFSLDVFLEGSIALGQFNIADHSWTLSAGESGLLKISSKPITLIKPISEIVTFLSLMQPGSGFALKARQDLFLTGLSSDEMLDYYNLCQKTEDAVSREQGQDALFKKASETLSLKGLNLKIYGFNSASIDRSIDTQSGGILFKAVPLNSQTQPHLLLTLLKS